MLPVLQHHHGMINCITECSLCYSTIMEGSNEGKSHSSASSGGSTTCGGATTVEWSRHCSQSTTHNLTVNQSKKVSDESHALAVKFDRTIDLDCTTHNIDTTNYVPPFGDVSMAADPFEMSIAIDPNDPFDEDLVADFLSSLAVPIETRPNYLKTARRFPCITVGLINVLGESLFRCSQPQYWPWFSLSLSHTVWPNLSPNSSPATSVVVSFLSENVHSSFHRSWPLLTHHQIPWETFFCIASSRRFLILLLSAHFSISRKPEVKTLTPLYIYSLRRGRNNSKKSGSQQVYLVGKTGSAQIYVIVIWSTCKQNNMTNTKCEKIPKFLGRRSDYCCRHLWLSDQISGSPSTTSVSTLV